MANANSPQGLRPVRDGSNRPYSGGGNTYYVSTSNGTALFLGDPVILDGGADANGVASVTIATAGGSNRITGAIVGFGVSPTLVSTGATLAASTAGYVIVEDDPNVMFEIQASTLAAADVGANSILASGTGSTTTGSGWYVDTATKGTTASLQVRILGAVQSPDNALGTYCKIHVRLNVPTEAGLATGLGF